MNRHDLLELRRLCLHAILYGIIAAVAIFAAILLIGWWRQ